MILRLLWHRTTAPLRVRFQLASQQKYLKQFFLPVCSPHLHPDEQILGKMKIVDCPVLAAGRTCG